MGRSVSFEFRQRLRVMFGALLESLKGIFHGREVHVGRHGFHGRRNRCLVGIGRRIENTFLEFEIALGEFILLVFEKFFQVRSRTSRLLLPAQRSRMEVDRNPLLA